MVGVRESYRGRLEGWSRVEGGEKMDVHYGFPRTKGSVCAVHHSKEHGNSTIKETDLTGRVGETLGGSLEILSKWVERFTVGANRETVRGV